MKLRVYLDTSVFSAYYDDRTTDRQAETQTMWPRLAESEASTSELASVELARTPNPTLRLKLEQLLEGFSIHPLTDEMRSLADRYVEQKVFSPLMFNDALHVAAAVVTGQNVLLSWNFKHLVNRLRRAKINDVNTSLGLPTIEIVAPPEL